MSCEDYRALISAALDGELSGEEQRTLKEHLAGCEECRAYREALRELSGLLSQDLPTPDESFCPAVMEKIRRQSAPRPVRRFPLRSLSLAASLLLLVGIGVYAGQAITPKYTARSAAAESAEEPMLMTASADFAEAESEQAEYAAPVENAPAQSFSATQAAAGAGAEDGKMKDTAAAPTIADAGADTNQALSPSRLSAENWLLENGKEDFSVTDVERAEEIPSYESCLGDYAPVGGSWLASCISPGGEGLTLLLDDSGTVYGIIREK